MGNEQLSCVTDTGPLLHLAEISSFELLQDFYQIFVPDAVQREYLKHKKPNYPDISPQSNILIKRCQRNDLSEFVEKRRLEHLHLGEKESLCLCNELSINTLLTDDLSVREVAKRLNIVPVGSIGVIIRAFGKRKIALPEAETHIYNLYEKSSLFVTKRIVEMVIDEIRNI